MMKHITLLAASLIATGAFAQITDGSFEAGIGAGTWTEASVTFGTPLCDAGSCGTCGGPCVPHTGSIYAWFGGSGDAAEIGSVEQTATIPTGTAVNLVGWVKIGATGDGSSGNYIRAYVDGNLVGEVTAEDSSDFVDYVEVFLPIDAYADGNAHAIKIEGKENGTSAFNGLVDDVGIEVDGQVIIGLFENEALAGINISPNPANEQVRLVFNAMKGAATITITDAAGAVHSRETVPQVSQRTLTMDTRNLANGAYVVVVAQEGRTYQQRLVIAH